MDKVIIYHIGYVSNINILNMGLKQKGGGGEEEEKK